jgi:hypothetical protein
LLVGRRLVGILANKQHHRLTEVEEKRAGIALT